MASDLSSLMDLVAQNQPKFETHQALLVIGLQNDFIQPDGRLPVDTKSGYLDRIQALIPKFRDLNGNVIWVQTLYEQDRIASDASTGEGDAFVVGGLIDGDESGTEAGDDELAKDTPPEKAKPSKHKQRALDLLKRVSARRKTIPREVAQATAEQDDELFLLRTDKKTPACVPDTYGAEFADVIARLFQLPADMVIRTTNYSAFQGTSLLMTLRAKLVTEVYICGCITNVSVLATVLDGARHGVKINIIEDCLGYRRLSRHKLALKRMDEFFDAYLVNSQDILKRERSDSTDKKPSSPDGSRKGSKGSDKPLDAVLGRLSLNDPDARPSSRPQSIRSPTKVLTGGPRKLSLASVAETRKTLITSPTVEPTPEPTDKQFADMLVKGAVIPGAADKEPNGTKEEPKMVSKKIRMRSKAKKKKKKEETDEEESKQKIPPEAESSKAATTVEPKPVTVAATATEATKSPPRSAAASPRSSVLAKAESVLNLRDRTRQQSLKSVASQPVLSAKADNREKEKDRESWSDRVRMSLTRASKSSDTTSESKKRASIVSTKAPSTISKVDSRPASIVVKSVDPPSTPARAPPPPPKEVAETFVKGVVQPSALIASSEPTAAAESMPTKMGKNSKLQSLATLPVLGPGDKIAEGDSRIVHKFFPTDFRHISNPLEPLQDNIFHELHHEVRWQKMLHQQGEVPRLVCCQGDFGEDGSMPVYRHPADQTLPLLNFSPRVQLVRKQAEKLVGHPLNHTLIQLYRTGNDYISEHSDKTLDIMKGSSIVNVSFGAQRTMRLRTKKVSKSDDKPASEPKDNEELKRETQRIAMPHNSMFVLDLASNAKWLHGIMPDRRATTERSESETDYDGMRISLTFRHVGTFIDAKEGTIWGQGATAKEQRDAADVINNDADEAERMIRAFSKENHDADFDWEKHYGEGFDVLHLHKPLEDTAMLFTGTNTVQAMQIQIALAEAKIKATVVDEGATHNDVFDVVKRPPMFRDNDTHHTQVLHSRNILSYIDKYYPLDHDDRSRPITANTQHTIDLAQDILNALPSAQSGVQGRRLGPRDLMHRIALLEDFVASHGDPFIAGRRFGVADCFVWPVVDHIIENSQSWDGHEFPVLDGYWRTTWKKKASVKKVRDKLVERDGNRKKDGEREKENGTSLGGLEGELSRLGLDKEGTDAYK